MCNATNQETRQKILRFIDNYTRRRRCCPTVREIGEAVGLRSSYAELQLTTLYYNRPHPAPQITPKNSNLTAVSYGQTRWAVSAAFGQQWRHSFVRTQEITFRAAKSKEI